MAEKMHSNSSSTSVDDQQTTVKLDNLPEKFPVRKQQQQQQQDEESENTSNEEKEEFQICSISSTTNKPSSVVNSVDEHKTDNNKLEKTSTSSSSSSILKPSLLSKSSPSKSSDHNNSILKPSNFTPLLNITSTNNKEDNDTDTSIIISNKTSSAKSSMNGEVKFVPLVKSEPQKANNSSLSATSASTFVFGQNLQERVISDNENSKSTPSTSNGTSSSSSNTLLFSSAIKNTGGDGGENTDNKLNNSKEKDLKSLTDYAREYEESRANKRKYDQVETITGEEEETNILNITCKLFSFDKATSNWQERGRGKLRLNDCEIGSRLVFRAAGSLRVILNTKIWAEMTLERASERSVRLTALDSTGKIKVFLITSSIEESKQLFSLLQSRLEKEIVLQKRKKLVENDNDEDEEMDK